MGYENVVVYPFGNVQWTNKGYKQWTIQDLAQAETSPEQAGPDPEAQKTQPLEIKQGEWPGAIDPDYFQELVQNNPERVQIIDVRTQEEFSQGHLTTAIRIETDELETRMDEFDTSEKPIVLVCSTGARSGEAYFLFQDMRPELEVYYLDANLTYSADGYSIEQP